MQIRNFLTMKLESRRRIRFWVISVLAVLTLTAAYRVTDPPTLIERLKLFGAVMAKIDKNYLEPKPPDVLVVHAIQGVISQLDPHSAYLSKSDFETWNQNYEGYCGIGITLDLIRDRFTVIGVTAGGPSEGAGIRPGDRIMRIDGASVIGWEENQIIGKIMGPSGSRIRIGVQRTGWPETREFIVMRGEVHPESIPYVFELGQNVGYCRILRFSVTTHDEIQKALAFLTSKGVNRMILDLRGNAGGYLEAAIQTAGAFLPKGRRVVYTRGRNAESYREYNSDSRSAPVLIPLLVLTDRFTASASEILAGALQDWDRAWLVGETTYGKGLVQSPYRFDDGSTLLLTTARYFTPSGRLIQRPYEGKSFDEYFAEILVDSLREKNLRTAKRPVYQTMVLKRPVLSGGGITPDTVLPVPSEPSNEAFETLADAPERYFFTFAERYARNHPELKQDFELYLKHYRPNNECLKQFYTYLRKNKASMSAVNYHQNQDRVRFLLKQYFAEILWGEAARYRVFILEDQTIIKAMESLPQAEAILKQAYFIQ
jgi:carboxyl-terminal processing protease